MVTKLYWIHTFANSARIGIMARPRGNDWLEDEIINLKNSDVDTLVSLLERREILELDLAGEEKCCAENGITYLNFPIPDRDIPEQGGGIDQLIDQLTTKVDAGLSVVIHCRMGIGRSSIVAAAVLLTYKIKAADSIETISAIRGLTVPDTDRQLNWLEQRELSIGNRHDNGSPDSSPTPASKS